MQALIQWVEAQPTAGIAVLMLIFTYALAAMAFGIAVILSRRGVAEELKTISPVTLTPLAVILGLLIAFLASRVWENVGHAHEYVGREATALSELVLLANALPADVRTKVRASVRQHIDFIEKQDWPAMASLTAGRTEPASLASIMNELLAFTPAQPQQQLVQQRALAAIAQAFEARRNRILVSHTDIAPVQWAVIIVLSSLIILTTALIHIGRPHAMAITLGIFSTAVAASLTLLMAYDRPFAPGGITLNPGIYLEINFD